MGRITAALAERVCVVCRQAFDGRVREWTLLLRLGLRLRLGLSLSLVLQLSLRLQLGLQLTLQLRLDLLLGLGLQLSLDLAFTRPLLQFQLSLRLLLRLDRAVTSAILQFQLRLRLLLRLRLRLLLNRSGALGRTVLKLHTRLCHDCIAKGTGAHAGQQFPSFQRLHPQQFAFHLHTPEKEIPARSFF